MCFFGGTDTIKSNKPAYSPDDAYKAVKYAEKPATSSQTDAAAPSNPSPTAPVSYAGTGLTMR